MNPDEYDGDSRSRLLAANYQDEGEYVTMTSDLPLMMASQEEFQQLSDQAESTKTVMETQFLTSFILQVFLSGALSMLWNIFNTMQIILAFNLLLVTFPANMQFF